VADAPIQAHGMTIGDLFSNRRFGITYYQREYSWSRDDVKALLEDLKQRFWDEWDQQHDRRRAQGYAPYFLGSIVYYEDQGTTYIVDGQQRITTLHLLLIHLRARLMEQESVDDANHLDTLIWSRRGRRSFVVDIEDHAYILRALIEGKKSIELRENASPSERYLLDRAIDLNEDFPIVLRGDALEAFVDWLLDRVCIAGVRAAGREHGWEIFETTNNRGRQLGPTDLLKSFLLSKAEVGRDKLNVRWREMLSRLSDNDPKTPSDFLKAYLLANFVDLRDDAERKYVNDAFHEWVRRNTYRMGLEKAPSYEHFIRERLAVTGMRYARVVRASRSLTAGWEHIYYNEWNRIPYHLTAVLAGSNFADSDGMFNRAASSVAKYLDILFVRKLLSSKVIDSTPLQGEVLELCMKLRECKSIADVEALLATEAAAMQEDFSRMMTYGLTPNNSAQVRYILARLTDYAECAIGEPTRFTQYLGRASEIAGRPKYQIEHIWAVHFERYREETNNDRRSFNSWRNRLGALILLPQPDNASYGDLPYTDKLETYVRQNILAASLHPASRTNHPRFRRFINDEKLDQLFRPFPNRFDKEAIDDRQRLYQRLCQIIWDPARLGFPEPVSSDADQGAIKLPASTPAQRVKPLAPRRRAARSSMSLQGLLDRGALEDGELLVGISKRPAARFEAKLTSDGRVETLTGEVLPDLDEAAAFLLGKPRKGWEFWHVVREGVQISLKDLRLALAREEG
jgi:hypothetical protein